MIPGGANLKNTLLFFFHFRNSFNNNKLNIISDTFLPHLINLFMLLKEVKLQAKSISSLYDFYQNMLELPVTKPGSAGILVAAGKTNLFFEEVTSDVNPFYSKGVACTVLLMIKCVTRNLNSFLNNSLPDRFCHSFIHGMHM
jgi:hypothetical protein